MPSPAAERAAGEEGAGEGGVACWGWCCIPGALAWPSTGRLPLLVPRLSCLPPSTAARKAGPAAM